MSIILPPAFFLFGIQMSETEVVHSSVYIYIFLYDATFYSNIHMHFYHNSCFCIPSIICVFITILVFENNRPFPAVVLNMYTIGSPVRM